MTRVAPTTFKYWAFISYSHSDARWADWLHKAIETYRVPTRLRSRASPAEPIPRRLYPVFRDRDELPSSPDLSGKIREALTQSRTLIVICSPRAAVSRWVDEEIHAFRALGRGDRVLPIIVEGEPNAVPGSGALECFPASLREGEPIAADARPGKDARENARLKLIAGILGVGFEELRQRERRRAVQRRVRTAALAVAAAAALALVYAGVADKGLDVPGAAQLRRDLDHYGLSVFRPVRGEAEVRQAAAQGRAGMITRMHGEWISGAWQRPNATRTNGPQLAISPWVTSQAMWGLFAAIAPADKTLPDFLAALDAPFAKGLPVEANGKKFGWLVSDADFPQAEPALWTVAALATALGRDQLLDAGQRAHLLARLAYAQEAADSYRPLADGGWNMFPQQDDPADHTTYATALALIALLELHHARLDWHGEKGADGPHVEAMLRASAGWLMREFDAKSSPPGWRAEANRPGPVIDGLTLQIYGELLRAEEEAGIVLPPAIAQAIADQVDRMLARTVDHPIAGASNTRIFTNYDGVRVTRWQTLEYIWLPGAIDVAARWLRRLERSGGAPEAKTQARRVLGYLVVDLGSRAFDDAITGKDPIYAASETLHALASIPPPR
jgi:hypothetical protein